MTTESVIKIFIAYTAFYILLTALTIKIFAKVWPLAPIWNYINSTGKNFILKAWEFIFPPRRKGEKAC